MKQSKLASWIESITSTAIGFSISLAAQWFFLPLLGVQVTFSQNVVFAIIMTFISIARGYAMRRVFEHFGIRTRMSAFMQAVIAERQRQISVEGWSAEHDDEHGIGELARAGAAYAWGREPLTCSNTISVRGLTLWPWGDDWYKPAGFRRDMVKAAALIVAEGEKHDRGRRRRSGRSVEAA